MGESIVDRLKPLRAKALAKAKDLQSLALLFGRLGVGLVFLSTGWGKVHAIDKVTAFFTELHIPAPHFHAIFVGYTELLCGAALVLGLMTRLSAIPLAVSMVVAIATARAKDLHGLFDLVTVMFLTRRGRSPLYFFGALALLFFAAGVLIDGYFLVLWSMGHGLRVRPLMLLGVGLVIVAIQIGSMGLLAEMLSAARSERETWSFRERL